MDKITIVDDDDNIIGYKERDELSPSDIYRVSALWLTNQDGEVLIGRRSYDKRKDPGKWGTAVAGTVEESETYLTNIIKESEEEIGLTDVEFREGPHGRSTGKYNFFYQWYLAETDKNISDFKIDKKEVEEVRWITKEQLVKEIKENPDEFISSMSEWRDMFV